MPRRISPGFTLVEVLLAVAIAGVVMAGAAASLQSGIGLWRAMERTAQRHQQVRAPFAFLARDLRQAVPFPGRSFSGTSEEISFVTKNPQGGLVRVTYQKAAAFQRLTEDLSVEPAPPAAQVFSIWPVDVRFAFPVNGPGAPWSDRWESDGLPPGVSLRLTLQEPGGGAESFEKIFDLPLGGD